MEFNYVTTTVQQRPNPPNRRIVSPKEENKNPNSIKWNEKCGNFLKYDALKIGLMLHRPSAPLNKKAHPFSKYFGKTYEMFYIPNKPLVIKFQ